MGTVKNIRKLSGASNELVAVDCAERDIQGRKIVDTYATKGEIPTELPANGGNASYATTAGNANKCNNHTLGCDVPANADFTNTWPSAYIATISKSGNTLTITPNTGSAITFTNTTYSNATQSAAGLMSSTDKTKLDGLNGDNYLAKAGGTMTGHLKWADSSALPSTTAAGLTGGLQFILGIKAFSDGGDTVYETRASLLSGLVRFNEAQTLTDAQKTQARNNIGASVKKYRHNIRLYWSGGSGSGYASGSLFFSFKDDTSSSYGASGFTHTLSTLETFLATHCGMTGNISKHLSVNGCATMGNTTAANLNYNTYTVTEINYESTSSYCNGTYLWQKKGTTPSGGQGIGYLDALFPTNASGNYIELKDDVEED